MSDHFTGALLQRASILMNQDRYQDAEKLIQQALSIAPDDDTAFYLLATCQYYLTDRQKDAIDSINRALAINSEEASYFALRALINQAQFKTKPALDDAETAIAIDPESYFGHLARGRVFLGMEKWTDAETSFRRALAIDPDNLNAGNLLAMALRHQNRSEETITHIESLLAKNPNDSLSHANAGWLALERHDLEKATFHFMEALRIDPSSDFARKGILETYKAKSPLYRAYLAYCFKMAKLPPNMRIGILLGLFFGVKLLRKVFTGDLAIVGSAAGILYLLFAMWSWVANGVGNFFLLFDRFARHALNKGDKKEALLVGGTFFCGIIAAPTGWLIDSTALFFAGTSLIGAAFTFSMASNNDHPVGRELYTFIGIGIVILAILSLVFAAGHFMPFQPGVVGTIIGVVVSWLGVFGIMKR